MVRMQEEDEYAKLDRIVNAVATRLGLKVREGGWTRKTYDIYVPSREVGQTVHVARVESFATTNGEIRVFDDRGLPFAEALGVELEAAFPIGEAVILRGEPQ